jgi:hypothetical protein
LGNSGYNGSLVTQRKVLEGEYIYLFTRLRRDQQLASCRVPNASLLEIEAVQISEHQLVKSSPYEGFVNCTNYTKTEVAVEKLSYSKISVLEHNKTPEQNMRVAKHSLLSK